MKKCKVCGKIFDYHVTTSHIEKEHNMTRKEYDAIKIRESNFTYRSKPYDAKESDITNYVQSAVNKSNRIKGR